MKAKYKMYEVADADSWRLPLLVNLLQQRYDLSVCGEDTEIVQGLIESLCSSWSPLFLSLQCELGTHTIPTIDLEEQKQKQSFYFILRELQHYVCS